MCCLTVKALIFNLVWLNMLEVNFFYNLHTQCKCVQICAFIKSFVCVKIL